MMKRGLILLLSTLLFFACQKEKDKSSPISAIPIDAALILETNDLSSSLQKLSENKAWQSLSNGTSIKTYQKTFTQIDSILISKKLSLVNVNPILISIHMTGSQSTDWLCISSTENIKQELKSVEYHLNQSSIPIKHSYSNATITEISNKQNNTFFSIHKELLFVSPKKILIEDAIRQLDTPKNLSTNKSFQRIYNSSNKKEDFNLFVNSKNFDKISPTILRDYSNSEKLAEWFQWDIEVLENGILMSGIAVSHDSLSQELSFFEGNKGQHEIAPSVLPRNTALFIRKSFENFKQYQRKRFEYGYQMNQNPNETTTSNFDYVKEFETWVDNELTWFVAANNDQINTGLVIHTADIQKVEKFIHSNADSLIEYRRHDIFKWNKLKLLLDFFDENNKNELKYACILREEIVLADDLSLIKKVINDFSAKRSLSQSEDYQNCMKKLNDQSNYSIYLQNPTAIKTSAKYLNKEWAELISSKEEFLNSFKSFAIQFNASEANCYTHAYLNFDTTKTPQTNSIWAVQLEAPLQSQINLVTNHYTKKKEIILQDELLNLYLISSEGKILWKRKLEEKIIGSVHQIDVFKNNKLQLLFNTKNKVFLIDRKGRDVESYPYLLPEQTNLPLALFDYEKNENYRILLSCGKKHFMFDKKGKLVRGWKLNQTKSNAVHAAKHFVVGGKDYILLAEENGTLNILNRRGEKRLKVKEKIDFSENQIHVVKGQNKASTKIVTIDKEGIQQNILFDGSIDNSKQFEPEESLTYTFMNKHEIIVEGNQLKVNGPQITLSHEFETDELTEPELKKLNRNYYLGITDTENSKSYLYRAPDNLVEGFPVYGKTAAQIDDIDLDGKINYIIGGESGMIYNYEVN